MQGGIITLAVVMSVANDAIEDVNVNGGGGAAVLAVVTGDAANAAPLVYIECAGLTEGMTTELSPL